MKKWPLLFALFLLFAALPARAANDIEEVTSPDGVTAWLIEDHKLPLISMHFAFRGGVEQDPIDKQGLASLTMSLLDEGAGPYDAAEFQRQLARHSIVMHFSAGRDALFGDVKALRDDRDKAFDLLHQALTAPHFDPAALERARNQQLTAMRLNLGDPGWQARYALFQHIFAGHPYSERSLGWARTLAGLKRDDVVNFAKDHLARDNLIVAVAGDITPDELETVLDQVFGDLPDEAKLTPIKDVTWPSRTETVLVPRAGTQTDTLFAMPGPKRDASDWYAAQIANYILGGGGFSSRLMHEVRDKKGLTYGISTDVADMKRASMIVGTAATDNDKTGKAWDLTLSVMRNFYKNGATEDEINAAKDYLTGSLPLAMTSTDAIADLLVSIQLDDLGIDFLGERNDLIRDVTPEDVADAIQKWFDPARLTAVMVGQPEGVKPTLTGEQAGE